MIQFIGADANGQCLRVRLSANQLWQPKPFCAILPKGDMDVASCGEPNIHVPEWPYASVDITGPRMVQVCAKIGDGGAGR